MRFHHPLVSLFDDDSSIKFIVTVCNKHERTRETQKCSRRFTIIKCIIKLSRKKLILGYRYLTLPKQTLQIQKPYFTCFCIVVL